MNYHGKAGGENSRKDPALRLGEEQQRQRRVPASTARPKGVCRNSQMLKVTLGQMDGLSVLSPHCRFPFPGVCSRVTG